jgi:hypothetical protein
VSAPIEATGTPDPERRALIESAQQPLLAVYGDLAAAFDLIAEAVAWWRADQITTEQAMEAVGATVDGYLTDPERGVGE